MGVGSELDVVLGAKTHLVGKSAGSVLSALVSETLRRSTQVRIEDSLESRGPGFAELTTPVLDECIQSGFENGVHLVMVRLGA